MSTLLDSYLDTLTNKFTHSDAKVRLKAVATLRTVLKQFNESTNEPFFRAVYAEDLNLQQLVANYKGKIKPYQALNPLLKLLEDKNSRIRACAAEILGMVEFVEAYSQLEKLLDDKIEYVRQTATIALGKLKNANSLPSLAKMLHSSNSDTRIAAVKALGHSHLEGATPLLIPILKDKNGAVRYFAAAVLGQIGNERAYQPLVEALNDKDVRVRGYAALGIGHIAGEGAFEILMKALSENDDYVKREIVQALGKLGDRRATETLLELLEKGDVPYEAGAVLGLFGEKRAIMPLIRALARYRGSGWGALFGALRRLGEPAKQQILAASQSDDPELCEGAFVALDWFITYGGSEKELPLLLATLPSNLSHHRLNAVEKLTILGDKQALPSLKWLEQNDPDKKVREAAHLAILEITQKK